MQTHELMSAWRSRLAELPPAARERAVDTLLHNLVHEVNHDVIVVQEMDHAIAAGRRAATAIAQTN